MEVLLRAGKSPGMCSIPAEEVSGHDMESRAGDTLDTRPLHILDPSKSFYFFFVPVGGIGTRGPGETKSEVDRRRVTRRIHRLERELRERREVMRREFEKAFKNYEEASSRTRRIPSWLVATVVLQQFFPVTS